MLYIGPANFFLPTFRSRWSHRRCPLELMVHTAKNGMTSSSRIGPVNRMAPVTAVTDAAAAAATVAIVAGSWRWLMSGSIELVPLAGSRYQ